MRAWARRFWPFTVRGTGALLLAVAAFVIAQRAGIPELLYFATLLVALLAASAIALLLTRGSGAVARVVSPEVPEVGGSATVTVRAGIHSALPTAPAAGATHSPPACRVRPRGRRPRSRRA